MKIVLFFIFPLLLCASSCDETQSQNTPPYQAAESAVKITASKLSRAYSENEVLADQVFKGKKLEVSGFVESISKDFTDDIYVILRGHDEFSSVWVYVKDERKAAQLAKGQKITVIGRGDGMVADVPIIKGGEVVK